MKIKTFKNSKTNDKPQIQLKVQSLIKSKIENISPYKSTNIKGARKNTTGAQLRRE
jgi:hypothetical protein